jgi:hypothetical protein
MRALRLALLIAAALALPAPASAESPVFRDGRALLAAEAQPLVEKLMDRHFLLLQEVEKDAGAFFQAYVIFERAPERCYALLASSERQAEYRPDLSDVLRIETHPDGPIDEHHMRILFVGIAYRLRYSLDPAQARITWVTDPGFQNSVRRIEGSWELFDLGGARTLGRFGTMVDVGPALPRSFQDSLTRKNVLRTVENVRSWVDSDGRWRP